MIAHRVIAGRTLGRGIMPAMSLPVLAKDAAVTVTAGAITPVTLAADLTRYGAQQGGRLVTWAGEVLHEVSVTAKALQTVLLTVAEAMDDGFLDELRAGMHHVAAAVELMAVVSAQLDQAMPVLDATTPSLKVMNSTLAQLNATITQLETLPGVRIARRLVARPAGVEVG
jgi:hypothetical protein